MNREEARIAEDIALSLKRIARVLEVWEAAEVQPTREREQRVASLEHEIARIKDFGRYA